MTIESFQLSFELSETCYFECLAFVATLFQLSHFFKYLLGRPFTEEFFIKSSVLLGEFFLFFLVPFVLWLVVQVRCCFSEYCMFISFQFFLQISQLLKFWGHFDSHFFVCIVELTLHLQIDLIVQILEIFLDLLLTGLKLESSPLFVYFLRVHFDLFVKNQHAVPSLFFFVARRNSYCFQLRTYFLSEHLSKLDQHFGSFISVTRSLQFEPTFSLVSESDDVIILGFHIV